MTYNIHLVLTNKASILGINKEANHMGMAHQFPIGSGNYKNLPGYEPQHLYITSSEEIKEGDRVLYIGTNIFWKDYYNQFYPVRKIKLTDKGSLDDGKSKLILLGGFPKGNFGEPEINGNWFYLKEFRKIVATDNKELRCSGLEREGAGCSKNNNCTFPICNGFIAKIPQAIIELYIREWNVGKSMKEVKLEEITDENDRRNWYEDVPTGKYWEDIPTPPSKDRLYTDAKYKRLKLTSDGYIIPLLTEQSSTDLDLVMKTIHALKSGELKGIEDATRWFNQLNKQNERES